MSRERLIKLFLFLGIFLALVFLISQLVISPKVNKRQESSVTPPRPELTIKIIEGWNLKQISNYLESFGGTLALSSLEIEDLRVSDFKEEYSFLSEAPDKSSLEGYLFPDTYRIYASSSALEIAYKMLDNLDNKLTLQMRQDIISQKKDLHEIITMASIIEKEVTASTDMSIVSGIFWNRIRAGQALQSCATLAYILGENKPQYSYEETRTPSNYNTYLHQDLPPGPISNPGIMAITAAIYPKETNYNYFLSDPKTGDTIYAKTYDEHLQNKNKYLK
jgi:UPF0755 protein